MAQQQFNFVELSQGQIDFLKEYSPKDSCYTSTLEMKQIISKFGLDEGIDVEQMRAIRNSVVRFYSNLLKNGESRFMESMQSVTAVIDYQMCKVG